MSRKRKKPSRRFIQIYSNVKRSQAYHGLSWVARCALIELLDRFTGCNNGLIVLSVRDLAEDLNASPATAARALQELDDSGLVHPMDIGTLKGRRATTWRFTFYRCDKTGELPVTQWPERTKPGKYSLESRSTVSPVRRKPPVASHQRDSKGSHCLTSETQNGNSSINDPAHCLMGETHIDIYQGEGELSDVQMRARRRAGIDLARRATR
jgi:hypothetical protein